MKRFVDLLLSWGPAGLFTLAVLDGAGVPIPGGVDVLILFLASREPAAAPVLAALAIAGSTIGNLILFYIAHKGGEMYLERHTLSRGGRRFREWFQHYGLLTVFTSALVPLPVMPMKIFVICAGALGTAVRSFLIVFVTARVLRYSGLAFLGAAMGDDALLFLKLHAKELVFFAAALFLALFAAVKYVDRRRRLTATT